MSDEVEQALGQQTKRRGRVRVQACLYCENNFLTDRDDRKFCRVTCKNRYSTRAWLRRERKRELATETYMEAAYGEEAMSEMSMPMGYEPGRPMDTATDPRAAERFASVSPAADEDLDGRSEQEEDTGWDLPEE